jgi:hypothetical protein
MGVPSEYENSSFKNGDPSDGSRGNTMAVFLKMAITVLIKFQ